MKLRIKWSWYKGRAAPSYARPNAHGEGTGGRGAWGVGSERAPHAGGIMRENTEHPLTLKHHFAFELREAGEDGTCP